MASIRRNSMIRISVEMSIYVKLIKELHSLTCSYLILVRGAQNLFVLALAEKFELFGPHIIYALSFQILKVTPPEEVCGSIILLISQLLENHIVHYSLGNFELVAAANRH